jgi:hypothetical protein
MSGWDLERIVAETRHLIEMSAQDADLRAGLRALATEILDATGSSLADEPPPASVPAESAGAGDVPGEPIPSVSGGEPDHHDPDPADVGRERPGARREPLRELTLGQHTAPAVPSPPVMATHPETDEDEDHRIAARCRAKSEAVRWQAESHRRVWEGLERQDEEAPVDPEMLAWADGLVDCFYWLDDEDGAGAADLSLLDDVGGCFEAVAEAIELVVGAEGRRGKFERALPLLAEAQSMLRRALQRLRAPDDPDQLAVFRRVREAATRHRIFVKRYMRADDLADPGGWSRLLARIEALGASGEQTRQQKARIDRLRGHLELIRGGNATDEEWRAVVDAVEEMVGDGLPPSNREVRDLLLPVIDDLPDRDDLPPGFLLVLREIDRFLATRAPDSNATASAAPPPEVKEAARLLDGGSVVLIGGARRREAQASLRRGLGLKELIWIETKEHQSIDSFESVIARPDVVLVLLAIRWSSHAFGDVRQYCVLHGKPLVRLPGGYGLHQVAVQIVSQSSDLLGGR